MANPENLRPWKPGESGNPNGRPPETHPNIKRFTKKAVQETFAELMVTSQDDLAKIRDDAQESGVRAAVASVILRARAKGEMASLDALIDRVIGKVPQKTELTGGEGEPLQAPVMHFHPIAPIRPKDSPELPAVGTGKPPDQIAPSSGEPAA